MIGQAAPSLAVAAGKIEQTGGRACLATASKSATYQMHSGRRSDEEAYA